MRLARNGKTDNKEQKQLIPQFKNYKQEELVLGMFPGWTETKIFFSIQNLNLLLTNPYTSCRLMNFNIVLIQVVNTHSDLADIILPRSNGLYWLPRPGILPYIAFMSCHLDTSTSLTLLLMQLLFCVSMDATEMAKLSQESFILNCMSQ